MEHTDPKPFAAAINAALTAAQHSTEQSTKASRASEGERKRHFLTVMKRWAAVFKRADSGDIEKEMWLIAEYFKAIGHLSPAGLEALTEQLLRKCTFFPTIRECIEIIEVPQLSGQWGNPFINRNPALYVDQRPALAAPRTGGVIGRYGEAQ